MASRKLDPDEIRFNGQTWQVTGLSAKVSLTQSGQCDDKVKIETFPLNFAKVVVPLIEPLRKLVKYKGRVQPAE